MRDHGVIKSAIFIVLCHLLISQKGICQTHDYYLCSYEGNGWGTNILFSKIDLDSKQILFSRSINLKGELETPKPLVFRRGNRQFFFVSTIDGEAAKNSEVRDTSITYYAILDENGNVLLNGDLPFVHLFGFQSFEGDSSIELRYTEYQNGQKRRMKGRLTLDRQRMPYLTPIREDIQYEGDIPRIDGFSNYQKISDLNNTAYWVIADAGMYLLLIDPTHNYLIDSLAIGTNLDYSYLFAISQIDSLIYSFHINAIEMGGPSSLQKLTVDPSYLIKYSLESLNRVDSINFEYPSLDYGYVYAEIGTIDWVGQYLVHYYFSGEDYRYFSPAMLFIFDTRTNEATWLRVGWR